ncbi:ABC transporter ATP-binding protein [Mycolicibacterium duvalii]|uniref:ATP-binding cassette domain-containing protein n=1 Tax=Mycolicibacterium duvalii TaxID=39688 RepID=UPI000BEEA437|nr:ATP-binding cassette domain-containing protein [Mycolicibacterium duvalii]MCV7367499.1 ABC transporter ATP-binding protein [Mycolicibacterium duvalii]PEG44276.1 ABC transporter ATP-binding protein [Mycolicibacterium duvalii]
MTFSAALTGLTVDIDLRRGRRCAAVPVLDQVNLEVNAGRVTALIGESGCGKSLVAAALSGLMPPGSRVRGQVRIGDRELRAGDEAGWRALRGRHIGVVPQSAATSLTPVRTVGSQLAEICSRLGADRTPEQLCAAVALPASVVGRYPHELSGGMAQRVAIAAALAGRPALLIADEPTSALDPDNAALVWRLLGEAAADGAAVLVITHDLPSLLRAAVCDEVAVMARGTVLSHEPLEDTLSSADPYLRALLGTVPV